tara:strand:- start:23 stop:355 length:333 start_codon:yes stop_codon:yes gene_type:complete
MSKKKTYQFDLSIRLVAEAESVDAAFEAALSKLDPDYVQIRSEVNYQETSRDKARIDPDAEPESGTIEQESISIAEGIEALLDAVFGVEKPVVREPTAEELLKQIMGDDN